MIKVIRHGMFKKVTCPKCTCEFMYENEDTKYVQTDVNEYERFVECPDCEERIGVKK